MGLREVRKRQLLSLEAVGYLADIDPATVSRIERGLVSPRPDTLVRLARALGMSVNTMRAHVEGSGRSDTGPEAA